MTLDAVSVDQLQYSDLLGIMLMKFATADSVAGFLVAHRGFHLRLNFEMILIRGQFTVSEFGKPVPPVFINLVFIFQISRVEFLDECSVTPVEITLLLH